MEPTQDKTPDAVKEFGRTGRVDDLIAQHKAGTAKHPIDLADFTAGEVGVLIGAAVITVAPEARSYVARFASIVHSIRNSQGKGNIAFALTPEVVKGGQWRMALSDLVASAKVSKHIPDEHRVYQTAQVVNADIERVMALPDDSFGKVNEIWTLADMAPADLTTWSPGMPIMVSGAGNTKSYVGHRGLGSYACRNVGKSRAGVVVLSDNMAGILTDL